jgi:hypothetical protein
MKMAHIYKRSTGLTILTIVASIDLGLCVLGLLIQITFLDYRYILNFYYFQNFIAGFLALIFLTGFIIFRKEFKERVYRAPKSIYILVAALILSLVVCMLNFLIIFYHEGWLDFLENYINFLSFLSGVFWLISPVLSLVGFALLSKEFTQHAYYIKATPTPPSAPYPIPTAPLRFCPSCGSQVFQDALFCQNCGKKLHT